MTSDQAPHPGAFIRAKIIGPHGLNVSDAAKVLGVTRPTLSNVLNGNASLSAEMAIRLEKAFGASMEDLVQMQTAHDIAEARKRADDIKVSRYVSATQQGSLL